VRPAQERRRGALPLRAGPAAHLRRVRGTLRHRHPAGAAGQAPRQGEDRGRRAGRRTVDPRAPASRDLLLPGGPQHPSPSCSPT
jgi:hypothetical protein